MFVERRRNLEELLRLGKTNRRGERREKAWKEGGRSGRRPSRQRGYSRHKSPTNSRHYLRDSFQLPSIPYLFALSRGLTLRRSSIFFHVLSRAFLFNTDVEISKRGRSECEHPSTRNLETLLSSGHESRMFANETT